MPSEKCRVVGAGGLVPAEAVQGVTQVQGDVEIVRSGLGGLAQELLGPERVTALMGLGGPDQVLPNLRRPIPGLGERRLGRLPGAGEEGGGGGHGRQSGSRGWL